MKASPKIYWKAYSIPKLGNRVEENEDALQPSDCQHTWIGPTEFTCALSDGATRTSFSSLWARLLVQEATTRPYNSAVLAEMTASAQARWTAELSKTPLPWHAEEKVRQGAFATLLWFHLHFSGRSAKSGGTWQATAVGDSCLFQIRKGTSIRMFPEMASPDFGQNPILLASVAARNVALFTQSERFHTLGTWCAGDEFLLMTDALAAWFTHEIENGSAPLRDLQAQFLSPASTLDSFGRWVNLLRESRAIKNDDTTVAWIGLDDKSLTSTPLR